jgi:uncharacterized membrane protein YqhA
MKNTESMFEGILWRSRYIVLLAVIASLTISMAMFYMSTVDAYLTVKHLSHYASTDISPESREILRGETVKHIVEVIDGYLLATVLLIFALGLYELFISKIDEAEHSETASGVLLITSLDDLKSRLAKVILMILIVRYFEHVISMHFETALQTLYLALGISFIGLALYLSHKADEKHH